RLPKQKLEHFQIQLVHFAEELSRVVSPRRPQPGDSAVCVKAILRPSSKVDEGAELLRRAQLDELRRVCQTDVHRRSVEVLRRQPSNKLGRVRRAEQDLQAILGTHLRESASKLRSLGGQVPAVSALIRRHVRPSPFATELPKPPLRLSPPPQRTVQRGR